MKRQSLVSILPVIFLFIYLFPYLLFTGDISLEIHDNLDSNVSLFKVVSKPEYLLAANNVPVKEIMNGLPRGCLPTEFNLITVLYAVFPPLVAYNVNVILIHLCAFFGMYLFLGSYFRSLIPQKEIIIVISAWFSMLPFFPTAGISMAGQPLLLYCFLNIYHKRAAVLDWVFIMLFPLYSNFIWSGIFVLLFLGSAFLIHCFQIRRIRADVFTALFLFFLLSLLSEYRILYDTFIAKPFISHRDEFRLFVFEGGRDILSMTKKFFSLLTFGYPEVKYSSVPFPFVNLILLAFILVGLSLKLKIRYYLPIILVACCAFMYVLWFSPGMDNVKESIFIFRILQFDRFYNLIPTLTYIGAGIAMAVLFSRVPLLLAYKRTVLLILFIGQAGILFYYNKPIKGYVKDKLKLGTHELTWNEFFAEETFAHLKDTMNIQANNRFLCLGIYPGILQFNDLNTVDGYVNTYPVEYKHKFIALSYEDLKRDSSNLRYFMNYGSRCYYYVSELPPYVVNNYPPQDTLRSLRLNREFLDTFKVDYVVSAKIIGNPMNNALKYVSVFPNRNGTTRFYLYSRL